MINTKAQVVPNSQLETAKSAGYTYQYVANDPLLTRIYTLSNGLKIYISPNSGSPRIQTMIAVRTGSKNDPAETTGLAHYLEHMLFKGTSKLGTSDWEKEKKLLNQIAELYELHKQTQDPAEKKAIYHKIDSLSVEASQYAIASEYDKLVSVLGASGTNAYTSNDQTVYINDIPTSEFERWMSIEAERMQELVLRLFHTELETVYEEFNMGQDNDYRKSWKSIFEGLFSPHPYGTQTTIGEGEHLKNPSMYNIHQFFSTYYVPNNMAVILAGDIDPDQAIKLADKYFGKWQAKEVPAKVFPKPAPLESPKEFHNYGSQAEHLYLGFAFEGVNSHDVMMMKLVSGILENGSAGLFDLDLLQKQKVLDISSFDMTLQDASAHVIYAQAREGQTLEQLKELILAELEKLKKGDFPDWLPQAVVNNYRLNQIVGFEDNRNRANTLTTAFIYDLPYNYLVHYYDEMEKISKQEIIDFVKTHYQNNYVVSYKHLGEDPNVHKVEKPTITPIEINRKEQSAFYESILQMPEIEAKPVFVDYQTDLAQSTLGAQTPFYYIENTENETFKLYYIFDFGADNDLMLPLAMRYLTYLGTDKLTAEQLNQEWFKLGLKFNTYTARNKCYVYIAGLQKSFEEGIELLSQLLANAQADEQVYKSLVEDILKERTDEKLSKQSILRKAMISHAKYGSESPFTHILTAEQLQQIKPQALTQLIQSLTQYPMRIFYFGSEKSEPIKNTIIQHQKEVAQSPVLSYPEAKTFAELDTDKNEIYFVDYQQKQVDILLVAKDEKFNIADVAAMNIFNEFFGTGLSSIVFQEIRESKALAYSAYAYFSIPAKKDEAHYLSAYLGTQSDKMNDAITAMQNLMNNLPKAEAQFNNAKLAALKKIATERVLRDAIFWDYENARQRGLDQEIREIIYRQIQTMSLSNFTTFFEQHVAHRPFTFLILGDKENINFDELAKISKVKELNLTEIFGF
ncbi:MAG: insulinase family protein [Chitinophagales bacterium]|nr:insulinase family protein [Bacteroidota bacterium]MCB9044405.1 insulinase family protein [Chitinophagales bacterium]